MRRLFSVNHEGLMVILRANLALLVILMIIAPFLPLSNAETGFVVLFASVLAGFNWALIARGKKRGTPPD